MISFEKVKYNNKNLVLFLNRERYGVMNTRGDRAAIGDDAYVTLKLKELEVKLCGSGTDTDKGELLTIASELAAADPHAAHAAIQYSLQARVDWVMGVHLPEDTKTPGRGRRPHPPRILRPLLRGGPSRPEQALGVTGRWFFRARPLCTPGQAGRRWLPTNSRARAVPQHPQQRGPTVPGNRTNPGPVALAGLSLRRRLLQRRQRGDQVGRLLRLWESHCAGSPVRVGQSPTCECGEGSEGSEGSE